MRGRDYDLQMTEPPVVTLEINQQQAQMLDRLIAEGGLGSTHGEVLRTGFLRFCKEHPELGAAVAAGSDGGGA
jgi:hypothetical protein